MKLFSPAKVNLFLHVTGKRDDGYHDIFSLMCPVSVFDEITIRVMKSGGITVECDHREVPSGEANIAHRAASLFFKETGIKGGVSIWIRKRIPVSAGLGGGSSNAASVLSYLNNHFGSPLSHDRLMRLGGSIGADIPFFIYGKPAIATGIGDKITPYRLLSDLPVIIVHPPISVSTAAVYERYNLTLTNNEKTSKVLSFTEESGFDFSRHMANDLEKVTALLYPEIGNIKNTLLGLGAVGALMSGSGPTVFGVFADKKTAEKAHRSISGGNNRIFLASFLTGQ